MNKYLSNLNRIEFLVTMACTGRCKHCSEGEHTLTGECIDADIAACAVYDICRLYSIDSLMTFGGEALLYPKTVCTIHKAAEKMKIPDRSLITNGFFSKNPTQIKKAAAMLTESGVNRILLSVDAFHQETIPIAYAKEFARAVIAEGIPITTNPAWLVAKNDNNPYNLRTIEILKSFEAMGIDACVGNVIFPEGNAKKYLKEYFDDKTIYHNKYEDDPADVRSICFSPNGDVLNGNIYRQSITEIMSSYIAK